MHGQTIGPDISVSIPLLFKVNKEKREVEGIATQEVKDVHGEIVDHESMKKVLLEWPGNIREMHQPKAVGKAVKVESDDERKATIVRAYVSKGAPDTWEKVLDGTLSMYSIGGTGKVVTTKHADGSEEKRIHMSSLHEISFVDNGACPTAKFEIVKSVDGQSIECLPADEGELDEGDREAVKAEAASAAQVLALLAQLQPATPILKAAAEQTTALLTPRAEEPVDKRAYPEPYDIECALTCIAYLERLIANEWWQMRDEESAGEDTSTQRAQVEILKHAVQLVLAFLLSEFVAQFEEPVSDALAMARRAGVADQVEKALPMIFGRVDTAGQLWFAKRGARHSKSDVTMIQAMHDSALALGAACTKEESKAAVVTPEAPVQTETPAAAVAEPVTPPAVPTSEPTKAADPAPVVPVQAPATPIQPAEGAFTPEAVQKLVAAEVQKALETQQATVTAQAASIADLKTQVDKLAADPAPGGPKTRATTEGTPVHKALGNAAPATLEGLDPATVIAVMTKLAKETASPDERERLTAELIKFQHATGAGAVMYRSAPDPPAATPATP